MAPGPRPFRDQDTAFGRRGADPGRGAGQGLFQGLDGRRAADAAQGHGRGGGHLGVGVAQPGDEAVDRPGVAPHAQRIDDSYQEPPLDFAHRLAQGLIGGRPGDHFQGHAGPRRQLGVGQQGRQGGNGVLVAVDGQLLAGERLIAGRHVRLEHLDQLALPLLCRALRLGLRIGLRCRLRCGLRIDLRIGRTGRQGKDRHQTGRQGDVG